MQRGVIKGTWDSKISGWGAQGLEIQFSSLTFKWFAMDVMVVMPSDYLDPELSTTSNCVLVCSAGIDRTCTHTERHKFIRKLRCQMYDSVTGAEILEFQLTLLSFVGVEGDRCRNGTPQNHGFRQTFRLHCPESPFIAEFFFGAVGPCKHCRRNLDSAKTLRNPLFWITPKPFGYLLLLKAKNVLL